MKSNKQIDPSAVQAGVDRLKQHPEPEAGYMLVRQATLPAYNVQTAVDAEHALIVAHALYSMLLISGV
jgi:transposase